MAKIYNWCESVDNNELENCVKVVKNGGIIIFPTETVYGIGANAYCRQSVEKIYNIKQRPDEKPLSILVGDKQDIEKYAIISNDLERKIIEKYMPGPLTIILKKKKGEFDYITSGKDTIGVRIPDNNIILSILKKTGLPLVAPSANISGKESGISLDMILPDFNNKVDICIDGGRCEFSKSSTIVQVVNGKVQMLRKGSIENIDID